MSFLSGIGGISQLYNEGAIYLTWHYITLNQGSLNFKKNHTHTKPKTLKPRDLQRTIISSQNRLLKQLGWMTLRRYPFSRIALWATVTSSNFNTHSYTFEDWQKKKSSPCLHVYPSQKSYWRKGFNYCWDPLKSHGSLLQAGAPSSPSQADDKC